MASEAAASMLSLVSLRELSRSKLPAFFSRSDGCFNRVCERSISRAVQLDLQGFYLLGRWKAGLLLEEGGCFDLRIGYSVEGRLFSRRFAPLDPPACRQLPTSLPTFLTSLIGRCCPASTSWLSLDQLPVSIQSWHFAKV